MSLFDLPGFDVWGPFVSLGLILLFRWLAHVYDVFGCRTDPNWGRRDWDWVLDDSTGDRPQ